MANETRPWMVVATVAAAAAIVLAALPPAPVAAAAAAAAPAQGESVLDAAMHFFTKHDAADALQQLDAVRPAPVTTAERELVIAALPREGEISSLTAVQRQKLAAVRRVLEVHGRESIYLVKVVDVRGAFVGLHARAVVLISELALDLLDAGDLQALVAHEIGHEYFWDEYFRARRDGDRPGLRRLELLCDGFAILTLRRAGTDAAHLAAALEKVVGYNRARFGAALNEDHHPGIGERRTFGRRLVAWLATAAGSGVAVARRDEP